MRSHIALQVGMLLLLAGLASSRRKKVIINNKTSEKLKVWCSSTDDLTDEKLLDPGASIVFPYLPQRMRGKKVFWCMVEYRKVYASWDIFGSKALYRHEHGRVHSYEIRDAGVFYKNYKIRGLSAGHNEYTLWEHYDKNLNPYGEILKGYVDGGSCKNIQDFMADKLSAVTMCNHQCMILFDDFQCKGRISRLLAQDGCTIFWAHPSFNDQSKSLRGC